MKHSNDYDDVVNRERGEIYNFQLFLLQCESFHFVGVNTVCTVKCTYLMSKLIDDNFCDIYSQR